MAMVQADAGDRIGSPLETSRFQIIRWLGAGGMGVVYEALDQLRGTRVALKLLRRLSPEALLRFKTEFRALQDLQHPNLVRLDELISDANQWLFTMELVDGVDFLAHVAGPGAAPGAMNDLAVLHTLDDAVEDCPVPVAMPAAPGGRSFDEARLRSALAQLVEGLAALHAAGKVHRDVKPSNVLVTPAGRVVLLDFGVIGDVRRGDSHVVGTPLYMAPEQTEARAVGPPADWYAVGMVLYQALTGRLPFGASPVDAVELKKRVAPPAPASLVPGVPDDLDRLCMDLLRIDPRERPDDAEVLRRLSLGAADPRHGRFVGRLRELDALAARLAAARHGPARALLIHGESGAGKTALVTTFLERLDLHDPPVVVFSGRCCERESVPYKAVDEVIDELSWYLKGLPADETAALLPGHSAALAQLFPVLQRVPLIAQGSQASEPAAAPRELRLRAFAALRELLASIARHHPVVLAIDDLQWADADSLALLADLVAPPAPPGILLLATVRSPGPHDALLRDADHLALTGLLPDEARELAALLLSRAVAEGDAGARIAQAIAAESGGHPMFIDELVRRTVARGAQPEAVQLDDALAARIQGLDGDDRAVLELVAVASAPLARDVAAATMGLGFDALARRLAALRAGSLIRGAVTTAGPAVEPYHDRVRRAVIAGVAPAERRALHGRLAVALEQRGADAELLAVHFHEAGEARRAAACAAVAAARAAQALAFDRAASLFRMAAAHEPPGTPEGLRLRVGLAEALANAGHEAEAARAFEDAAAGAGAATAVELRQRAADQYLRCGHIDAGLAAMGRVLAPLGLTLPRTPRRALASLVVRRARLWLRGLRYRERAAVEVPPAELTRIDACYSVATSLANVDHVRGADFGTRNLLWALRAGEPYRVARALVVEAGYAGARGVPGRARSERFLGRASALADRVGHPYLLGLVEGATGALRFYTGDWRASRVHCEQAREILRGRCLGMSWELHTIDFLYLWVLFYQGAFADVVRRVPPLLREANERGDLYAATNFRTSFTPLILLAADRPLEARREGSDAIAAWSSDGFYLQHYNHEMFSEGQISIYLGEADAAHRRIARRWSALRGSMLAMVQQLRIEAVHLRARCALAAASAARGGARDRWLAIAARDARRLARETAPWCRGWIDLLRAGIAAERGDRDTAAALARDAAGRCDGADMALFAAAARRRLGELVGGTDGGALIAAADAWMTGQGIANPRRMTLVLAPGFADR